MLLRSGKFYGGKTYDGNFYGAVSKNTLNKEMMEQLARDRAERVQRSIHHQKEKAAERMHQAHQNMSEQERLSRERSNFNFNRGKNSINRKKHG